MSFFKNISNLNKGEFFNINLGFKDGATQDMYNIVDLHNTVMIYLIIVVVFVFWMLKFIVLDGKNGVTFKKNGNMDKLVANRKDIIYNTELVTHGTKLEIVWTIVPTLILVAIAIPSFSLLYSGDEHFMPEMGFIVEGRQWFWTYADANHDIIITHDSIMRDIDFIAPGGLRLLEVDYDLYVPQMTNIHFLVTSRDVIHSWAIPALGIKVDAIPGRLNSVDTFIDRTGVFKGQCSEICGINHGFMPISINVVNLDIYEMHLLILVCAAAKFDFNIFREDFLVWPESISNENTYWYSYTFFREMDQEYWFDRWDALEDVLSAAFDEE